MTLRELHLFAGIGGGVLGGLLLGHVPVCAVEIDPYCRKVLRARQAEGILPVFPVLEDVRQFDGSVWRGKVDVVCGGTPCQPWSTAGKRRGTADPRHLWPEMARIVRECRPRYVFAENVALAAFQEPYSDLVAMGYRVPPALRLGAWQLGAPFVRDRWWLLASDADRGRLEGCSLSTRPRQEGARAGCAAERGAEAGDPDGARLAQRQGDPGNACQELAPAFGATWRAAAPRLQRLVSRAARGMDSRRQRIAGVGNAQVPAVAAAAFSILMRGGA